MHSDGSGLRTSGAGKRGSSSEGECAASSSHVIDLRKRRLRSKYRILLYHFVVHATVSLCGGRVCAPCVASACAVACAACSQCSQQVAAGVAVERHELRGAMVALVHTLPLSTVH